MELLKNNKEGRATIFNFLIQHQDEEITIEQNDSRKEYFIIEDDKKKFQLSEKLFNSLVEAEAITKL